MKQIYRNCEINVYSENCLGGWPLTYYSAFTKNGYEICCDFTEGPIRDAEHYVRCAVDEFIDEYHSNVDLHMDRFN